MIAEVRDWVLYPLELVNSEVGYCDIFQDRVYRKIVSVRKDTLHGRFIFEGVVPIILATPVAASSIAGTVSARHRL